MECRGAGGPPVGRMGNGKQAKIPMFSIISRKVRQVRQGNGRYAGGNREGRIHADTLKGANKGRGRNVGLSGVANGLTGEGGAG